jgi:LCP family protein required for cell wall assembly
LLPNPDTITVLLLGIDRRPDEGGPSRSDAIAVVHVDLTRQRVALLSLPRDLIVAIPEVGNARINSAMVYGELNPELGGGMELARRTVENLLNVPINDVVEVDFMGFIAAVDSLGGVMVNVEQPLYDATYPTMDYGYQTVAFAPGLQYMDGATALIYGRIRHADSDFERMKRQQSIMLALVEQVRGQHVLQQLQSLAGLTSALRGYVRTTMSEERMVSLAWELQNIDLGMVERYTLTRAQTASGQLAADPFALFALPGVIDELSRKLIGE